MIEKAPSLFAVAVPNEEEPLNRVTVEPASAVPEIVGVESLAAEEVDKDVGAFGAVLSVKVIPLKLPEEESNARKFMLSVIWPSSVSVDCSSATNALNPLELISVVLKLAGSGPL